MGLFYFLKGGKSGGVLLFALFFMVFSFSLKAQEESWVGRTMPAFALLDSAGEFTEFQEFEGALYVFDFWATWCAPCIKAIPAMQVVEKNFQGHPEVVFLYVNTLEIQGRDRVFIDKLLKNKGLQLNYFLDRGSEKYPMLSKSLDIRSLPGKLIVSKSGEVLYQDRGFAGSNEELISHVSELINRFLDL